MKLTSAGYGIKQLQSRNKATGGRLAWFVVLIVIVVVVVACTANAAAWCQTCSADANQAVKDAGDDAWLCNYDCNTSGCGAASWTCHFNVCKPTPDDDEPDDSDASKPGDGDKPGGGN